MKNRMLRIIIVILLTIVVILGVLSFIARFVYLAPSCYSDNKKLTKHENYLIKKTVLQAVEDRLSVFANIESDIYDSSATNSEIIQLDEPQNNRKHIFIWINTDFMKSVTKENGEYIIRVKTYYMESVSDDCVYEIHMSEDFSITFFGLDP